MGLSNDYRSCHVLDLDPDAHKRGPFVVTQVAVAEDDPQQLEKLFLLKKDGVWVDYLALLLQPFERQAAVFFDSLTEIITLLESLPPAPRMEPAEVSAEDIKQFLAQVDAAGGMLAFIQQEVEKLRALRKESAQG